MFSREISQIFKNTFFTEHLWWLLLGGACEGTSLVKILHSCHFDIFWINYRCFRKMPIKRLFIWKWAGPVRRAGSPRWDNFYLTFIWNLLSQFNQKVCSVAGKRLFDQVVFTINNDVKPSCRTNVLILFN